MFSLLPVLLAAAAAPVSPEVPRIAVEGFGSVKTPPNVANLSYDVLGEGKTSDQAVTDLVAKSAAIEQALRSMDSALKLESEEMRVRAIRGSDCKDEDYDETMRLSTGACAIVGYVAKQEFDILTGRVSEAGTMVGLAGRHGAANPSVNTFKLADQRHARQQAIAAALADAKAKAETVAAGSNAALGDIISVSLDGAALVTVVGQEEIQLRQANVAEEVLRSIPGATPVTVMMKPGPVENTARVVVNYQIRR